MSGKKNLLEKLSECYKILKNKQSEESFSVNQKELEDEAHRKKMFSLERELSDLMDTGVSQIAPEDERKYLKICYVFRVSSNKITPTENAYALVRESYVENDKGNATRGTDFMNARIPAEVIPEKIEVGHNFNGSGIGNMWYISKESLRIFGFTYDTFEKLFYRSCNYTYIFDVAVIDKDTSVKVDEETIFVEMHIGNSSERNYPKKDYARQKIWDEERIHKEEQEQEIYLALQKKFKNI